MAYRQRHDSYTRDSKKTRVGTSRATRDSKRFEGSYPPSGSYRERRRPSSPATSTKSARHKPPKAPTQPPTGGLFSAKIVAAIFFIFVFIYIGHAIYAFWTPTVDTMILRMSTLDVHQSVNGVIIRDEHVHVSDNDGNVEFHVPDNEWVASGTFIASVGDIYMADAAALRLSNVENQAIDIQNRRQPISIVDTEVQRLNNSLVNTANARVHNFASLNMSEIYSLHDQLSQGINARNQINIVDGVTAVDSLAREQDRHMSVLTYSSRNMYASTSGFMSRHLDGMESFLNRANINNLTREEVQTILNYDYYVPRNDMQTGDPVFRIVGNVWYIMSEMPNSMITGFEPGTNRNIYLYNEVSGDYEVHNLRIQSIDYGTRYSLVVFRSTRHVMEFINQRSVSIRTTSGVQRGLKLPCTAIITRQYIRIPLTHIHNMPNAHVIVSAESGDIVVPVDIENVTEHYAYVTQVSGLGIGSLLVPYDQDAAHILLLQENIRELHGIFINNLGVADFRLINLGDDGIAVGYVLLDPALNPNLREFTNIVSDASLVTEGQLINR